MRHPAEKGGDRGAVEHVAQVEDGGSGNDNNGRDGTTKELCGDQLQPAKMIVDIAWPRMPDMPALLTMTPYEPKGTAPSKTGAVSRMPATRAGNVRLSCFDSLEWILLSYRTYLLKKFL